MILSVNTDAVIAFTKKLEKIRTSALPTAIARTLNKAALDMKQKSLLEISKREFTSRQANFFRANSNVEFAKGVNIKTMKATVGMVSNKLTGGNNHAVKDLEEQEFGGTIKGKSFIPLKTARSGSSTNKPVKANARLSGINKIVNARNQKGKTKAEKFTQAAIKAGGGGFVLGSPEKGEQILWRIDSVASNIKNKSLGIKKTPLYDYVQGRSIRVSATHFMKKSALKSSKKMEQLFIQEAKKILR